MPTPYMPCVREFYLQNRISDNDKPFILWVSMFEWHAGVMWMWSVDDVDGMPIDGRKHNLSYGFFSGF